MQTFVTLIIAIVFFSLGWYIGPARFIWSQWIMLPASMIIIGAFCRFFWIF